MAHSDRLRLREATPPHSGASSEDGSPAFQTARARISVAAFCLLLLQFVSTMAAGYSYPGKIGVDIELKYGVGIIPPRAIVRLLQFHAISRARLFDANASMLQAFAHSGIDLIVSVPNEQVSTVARSGNAARRWVAANIVPFPATKISAILVGRHWLSDRRLDPTLLLPAIRNVNSALTSLGLSHREIRVSTSNSDDLLSRPSWVFPPSLAAFKPSLTAVLLPVVNFLIKTDSFFDVDISPYDAYINDPSVSLSFVLFESTHPIRDNNTGLEYYNMFDVQVDAIQSALQALRPLTTEGTHGTDGHLPVKTSVRYSWKDKKKIPLPPPVQLAAGALELGLDQIASRETAAATIANARIFNQQLINHVLTVKGTPRYPTQPLTAYIFELFNEALRLGPETEKHYGLFYPNGTSVYPIDFCSPYL